MIFVHTQRYNEDGTGRCPAVALKRFFSLARDLGKQHDSTDVTNEISMR